MSLDFKSIEQTIGGVHMPIEEQKEIAKDVMAKLKKLDGRVVLAGGAPRDWHFGKSATDLDYCLSFSKTWSVFPDMRDVHTSNIAKLSKIFGVSVDSIKNLGKDYVQSGEPRTVDDAVLVGTTFEVEKAEVDSGYAKNTPQDIAAVYDFTYKNMQIQIINLETSNFDAKDFSLTISQAYTYDCEEILGTSDFFYSVDYKVILPRVGEVLPEGQYLEKIKYKFPDYHFFNNSVDFIESGVWKDEK